MQVKMSHKEGIFPHKGTFDIEIRESIHSKPKVIRVFFDTVKKQKSAPLYYILGIGKTVKEKPQEKYFFELAYEKEMPINHRHIILKQENINYIFLKSFDGEHLLLYHKPYVKILSSFIKQ